MKNKGFFKLYVILTVLGFLSYTTTVAQINENFQSWTSRGSYGTYTQAGSGGTWNMVQCIVSPTGASSGVGSTGFVQLQSANGILTLPNIVSGGVGTISVDARVSGANGGFSIQKSINNGAWTNVQTYTSSSTTGVNFTATVNDASANLRLRINNTGGSGNRALYVYDVVTTVAVVPCTSPDRIEFATQPTSGQNIQQGVTIPLVVKAVCGAGGATDTGLNTGSVTIALNTGKCGLRNSGTSVTTITANFVNGVATFSNVTIGRSTQSGLTFTTTNTQSLTNATTNSFNITAPGSGTPTNTTIASEDFEGGTTWAYSIGTPSYSGSGGGTDATGVKTISSNNVMAKSYSTNNASDEKNQLIQ
ncbi:MAG: hypothetical protein M0D57_18460 [Sphingobacteriales bacterium JAD_PAG50586_3]|nr:MAG: hypothetical protein M0D57_18460 [Sphingobacteriales bacterium JAD_PAG50586_3]